MVFPIEVVEWDLIMRAEVCEKDFAREYERYKESSQAALDVYNRREVGCVCVHMVVRIVQFQIRIV